jgi:ketosteroid isomerase-like protein
MGDVERNLEVVRQLVSRWNAGDTAAFLELYSDDLEMVTDPDWPDPSLSGRAAFASYIEEWRGAWEAVELNLASGKPAGPPAGCPASWSSAPSSPFGTG